MSNLRYISSRIILDVTEGRSLSDSLDNALPKIKNSRDRALIQAICYGVCRFYTRLDVILSHLLKKPMDEKDSDVHALLMVGLYQLMDMRVPEYAAVTETVNATEKLKKAWSRGFVNAILREYLRNRESLADAINEDEEAFHAHPEWWIKAIKKAWPDQWKKILDENNQHPPFALRVNKKHLSREEYLEKLHAENLSAHIIPDTQQGIILDEAISMDKLPGFYAGDVSVQDGAAQLAAELLDLQPGQHVLDACAAPGGKLTHILEIMPDISVVAVEKDSSRIKLIQENLTRLKMEAECICADVSDIERWWDGKSFDRILLDAPCSASGVVRRHPDIKLLRAPSDIRAFAVEQKKLLTTLWQLLKPNGLFLYATCSIFPEENSKVIESFLATHADAKKEMDKQILPGEQEMDGFYYALIRKI